MVTYGLIRGLWESHWPWSRTNRELYDLATKHGRARRVIRIDSWLVRVDVEIEVERRFASH